MARIGFVTGIKKEAAILRATGTYPNANIACAGANTDRAYHLACKLAQNDCDVLISFGVAGALDPLLGAGDLVLPRSVIIGGNRVFETNPEWHQKMTSHLSKSLKVSDAPLFGSTAIISDTAEKQRLNQSLGAVAVDMESLGVAKAAQEFNRPFLIVRSISDTADQNLPAATLRAIDENGNIRISKVLWDLAKNPTDLPSLLKLARNNSKAFATLNNVTTHGFGL